MALQWYRRTQITGLPGQVADIIRLSDGLHVSRHVVPSGGVVGVKYPESMGECVVLLHDRGSESLAIWQSGMTVASGTLVYSPELPGMALRCAKGGQLGSVRPRPSDIRRGWRHQGDLTCYIGDYRVGKVNSWSISDYAALDSGEDGPAHLWPNSEILHITATQNYLIGLRRDGTLMLKKGSYDSTSATFYSQLKSLTGVVHVECSQYAAHVHLTDRTIVTVFENYDTEANRNLYSSGVPVPGVVDNPGSFGMRIVDGALVCQHGAQQAAVGAFDDVLFALTNSYQQIALVRSTGDLHLLDPASPSGNRILSCPPGDEWWDLGADDRSIWAVSREGLRPSISRNEPESNDVRREDIVAAFGGIGPKRLLLSACPWSQARLNAASRDMLATLHKTRWGANDSMTKSIIAQYGRGPLVWKEPQYRILVNGTASFYAEPLGAALLYPAWERVEEEPSGAVASVACSVTVDGMGASRAVLALSWPSEVPSRLLWEGRTGADGQVEAAWSDPQPGEQALLVAIDEWGSLWTADTDYATGAVIRPSAFAGTVYVCILPGRSAATEPDWWVDGDGAVGTAVFAARPYRRPLAHGPITPTVTSA